MWLDASSVVKGAVWAIIPSRSLIGSPASSLPSLRHSQNDLCTREAGHDPCGPLCSLPLAVKRKSTHFTMACKAFCDLAPARWVWGAVGPQKKGQGALPGVEDRVLGVKERWFLGWSSKKEKARSPKIAQRKALHHGPRPLGGQAPSSGPSVGDADRPRTRRQSENPCHWRWAYISKACSFLRSSRSHSSRTWHRHWPAPSSIHSYFKCFLPPLFSSPRYQGATYKINQKM